MQGTSTRFNTDAQRQVLGMKVGPARPSPSGWTSPRRIGFRSTAPTRLKNQNAKIKRRTNVVGILPNERAITRFAGAIQLAQNGEWTLQRRTMQLEGLQSPLDPAPARLPAVQR